jgi:hypothetical protein
MQKGTVLCGAAFLFVLQAALLTAFAEESDIKITPSGFAYYQIGQIEHQTPSDFGLKKPFDQHFNGRLTFDALINQRLRIIVGGEAELGVNINDETKKVSFIFKEAQGCYSFGDPAKSFLQITAGYFPYKYNPESRNMGEYLYRTGSYPGFIINDFDNAKARLMGFKFSSTLFDNLQINALFTSEYNVNPFFDYSLSFVAGYKLPNRILDFGLGVDFDRLVSIERDRTTVPTNYALDDSNNYIIENGDTLRYTMKGTKIMGRVTFDPKPLLPFADIFGPDDGKLYAEIAVLGTKNYGTYYNDIAKRIPIMFGFNIPCCKIIDVISYEWEYYPSDTLYKLDIPTSGNPIPNLFPVGVKKSNVKWSFYGKKTLTKGFAIVGLIGRDHYRSVDAGGNYDSNERMNAKEDWHYNLRFMFSF